MKNNFKNNIVKYIFIIVVIGLIIFAVYTIYKDENRKGENKTPEKQTETTQIKELRLGITDFDTLNPILSNNKKVQDISKIIYEPLFNVTQDYHLENCLAEECSRTGDTSYILKLKKNVKWQNGTDFTAKDVQFTIDRLKDTPSIYTYNV
ncbi:MAG: ABC transporter substrate-binding protein, partial [Clostridia bacterium]